MKRKNIFGYCLGLVIALVMAFSAFFETAALAKKKHRSGSNGQKSSSSSKKKSSSGQKIRSSSGGKKIRSGSNGQKSSSSSKKKSSSSGSKTSNLKRAAATSRGSSYSHSSGSSSTRNGTRSATRNKSRASRRSITRNNSRVVAKLASCALNTVLEKVNDTTYKLENTQCLIPENATAKATEEGSTNYTLICNAGYYTAEAGNACTICLAGSYCVNGKITPCDYGYYSESTGASACTKCGDNTTTMEKGATAKTACVALSCPSGYIVALKNSSPANVDTTKTADIIQQLASPSN